MSEFYIPKSAMAITAHPDDIEYSYAGTLARWAKAGTRVCYVVCTSGEVGIAKPGMSKETAAHIREAEQRAAADIAGAKEVIFLHEPDGLLLPTLELRKKLVREIRRFRPEVIVCSDPTVIWAGDDYINHPDHRAAAMAALDATFPAAGQPNLFEELEEDGLKAHKPRKVYVLTSNQKGVTINIDETIDIKVAALRAHASQIGDWDPEPMLKKWANERAEGNDMKYAESFRVITLLNDEEWEKTHGRVLSE
jgi:LmbE family N-acetylglucosaminyl deacetylase